jgi:ubiquinone biosynthesis protein
MKVLGVAATVLLVMATGLAMTIAFALIARRLLGLRFGLVRMLLAGALALAVMGPISRSVLENPATEGSVTPLWLLILALAATTCWSSARS